MDQLEDKVVRLKSHRKTGSGVSVSSKDGPSRLSDVRLSGVNDGAEEILSNKGEQPKEDILRKLNSDDFRQSLNKKLSVTPSANNRYSDGDILDRSPTNTLVGRSQTLRTIPSLTSIRSNTSYNSYTSYNSFSSVDELDSAYTALAAENKLPPYQEIKREIKKNTEMNSELYSKLITQLLLWNCVFMCCLYWCVVL